MRYRRPFDFSQRAAAAHLYQQFRANIREIREKFPPETDTERAIFRDYRKVVQDFARELLAKNDKVNIERLNKLEQYASRKAIEYNIESTIRRLYDSR